MNILKNIEKIKKRTLFYNLFLCKVYKILLHPTVEQSNKNNHDVNLAPPNCGEL